MICLVFANHLCFFANCEFYSNVVRGPVLARILVARVLLAVTHAALPAHHAVEEAAAPPIAVKAPAQMTAQMMTEWWLVIHTLLPSTILGMTVKEKASSTCCDHWIRILSCKLDSKSLMLTSA
jgi:hypothetical protein